LGFLSRCEIVDAWLETQVDETQIVERVQAAVPPGLVIERVETVSLQEPALQTQVQSAEYLARLLDPVDVEQLRQTISNLLSADHLPRERRGKEYDLRPLIEELVLHPGDEHNDQPILFMRLTAREGATGRPEEVLAALGLDSTAARIERTGLNLA
jgi:radical SAM-linked protein